MDDTTKTKNLFTCNKCRSDNKTEKVVVYDLANILCFSCRSKMQDEIMDIAKRYLINAA